MNTIKNYAKILGPGLLYAGAAIGVSHLVQSTRAGASFGTGLIWVIILSNIIKYPFFEYGPRYTAATGECLLHGYKSLGKWAVALFFVLTLATMCTIQSAISIVTAGLAREIFHIDISVQSWAITLLIISATILYFGKYKILDNFIKFIIILLSITTVISFIAAVNTNDVSTTGQIFNFSDSSHLFFLAALIGWMPAPIDISIWHSIWSKEKNIANNKRTNLKDALLDFNIGFIGTAILAICFTMLGALVMYDKGLDFSSSAVKFSSQLISLYTTSLGSWSYPIIAIAAFTTMFSTTITCLDAFPRVLQRCSQMLFETEKKSYTPWTIILILGCSTVISFYLKNMKQLVDLATTISFIVAPILALLNLMVINKKDFPNEFRPPKWNKALAYTGVIFLFSFATYYCATTI